MRRRFNKPKQSDFKIRSFQFSQFGVRPVQGDWQAVPETSDSESKTLVSEPWILGGMKVYILVERRRLQNMPYDTSR